MTQEPKILHSSLTDEWYFVPSYEHIGGNQYRANKKINITKQLEDVGLIERKERDI